MQAAEESVHKFGLGGCSSRHEYGEMSKCAFKVNQT